jgi:hypothetical protein
MAEEVLVKEPLTPEMLSAGERVTQALGEKHFNFTLTFWLYTSAMNEWRLMVATPLVDDEGPRSTYARLGKVLPPGVDQLKEFDLLSITVISPNDPLAKALKSVQASRNLGSARLKGSRVKDVFVEDAYVYPHG